MFLFLMKYNFILSGSKAKTEKKKTWPSETKRRGCDHFTCFSVKRFGVKGIGGFSEAKNFQYNN